MPGALRADVQKANFELGLDARGAGDSVGTSAGGKGWAPSATLLAAADGSDGGELRSILKRPPGRMPAGTRPQAQAGGTQPEPLTPAASTPAIEPPAQGAGPQPLLPDPGLGAPSAGAGPALSAPAVPPKRDIEKVPSRLPGSRPATERMTSSDAPSQSIASKAVSSRRPGQVGSAGTSGEPGGGSADALATVVGPLVRVDTHGPAAVTIQEEATYTVTLANEAPAEARSIVVRVGIPANVRLASSQANEGTAQVQQDQGQQRIVWTVDRVPGRAARQLTLVVVPQDNRPFDLAVDWALAPLSMTATVAVRQPLLELALTGPREVLFGETKVFTLVVSNPGTGDAKNVSAALSLGPDSADKLDIGTIPAGTNKSFEVEITARQAGTIKIVARASADSSLKAEAAEEIIVRRAELHLAASGPGEKFSGATGEYEVKIANTGSAPAKNVTASVRTPRGVKYVSGVENAESSADLVTWRVGDVAPGSDRTYRIVCQLTTDGEAQFQFAARGDGGLEASGEVLTKVEALADLKLVVNDPVGPVPVGELVKYEVRITNRGTKAAEQVRVVAQFSDGIEPTKAEGAPADVVSGQVVFQPIARIAAAETVTLTVAAKAATGGNHAFRAEVTCGPDIRLVSEETTKFFDAGNDSAKRQVPSSPSATNRPAPRVGSRSAWSGGPDKR